MTNGVSRPLQPHHEQTLGEGGEVKGNRIDATLRKGGRIGGPTTSWPWARFCFRENTF
jgi:hypothetical protein